MHVVAVWVSLFLAHSSKLLVAGGQQYATPLPSQKTTVGGIGYSDKRVNIAEPSCEELRAMWRYSKRHSRAAEITNEIPTYRDPFSYNVWEPYLDRAQSSLGYKEGYAGQARSRGAGGVPIYGRVIHKAPAGHTLRNGMPDRTRAFEEVTRLYGTVNRYPALTSRRRPTSFRIGGGASPSISQVPQAGSFQHLKELIRTERARELQEQRIAEEMAARAAVLKEMTSGGRYESEQESRPHFLNSLQPYRDTKNTNYDYDQARYVSNIADFGQTLSRGDQYGQEYMLR